MWYIITADDYLTRLAKVMLVKDYNVKTAMPLLFDNIETIFGFLRILMIDQGTHVLVKTIATVIEEFHIYHQKSTPFNKILETTLTKVCNV